MPVLPTREELQAAAQGIVASTSPESRPDLIASRYDGVAVGPRFLYTFEGQSSTPVDGSTRLARDLSPFTLSFIPPLSQFGVSEAGLSGAPGTSVRTYDAALASVGDFNASASNNSTSLQGVKAYTAATALVAAQAVANGMALTQSSTVKSRPALSDAYTALDLAAQNAALQDAPELTLLVNPAEFSIAYTAVQSYAARGRNGLIFQRWGEQQPQLTFSGSTGAFIAGASRVTNGQTNAVSGMQFAAKRDSAAWQNFMALYHFYRNNGYAYDTFGGSEAHIAVGAVKVTYDQVEYEGHIDAFNYTYDEANPHRVVWDLTFTCSSVKDVSQSPVVVLPQTAPTQSPSQVRRAGSNSRSFDVLTGTVGTVTPDFAQTPLDFVFPSEDLP
jgi:hypothetical protein